MLWVKIKTVYVNWRRGKKKFKDDITYKKDMAVSTTEESTQVNCCKLILDAPFNLVKHVILSWLCYSGFIRLMSAEPYFKLLIVFCHTFELMSHTLPFLLIQQFNNSFLAKFTTLEWLNLVTSLLNIFFVCIEIYHMQLMSDGGDFLIVNRSKLGYDVVPKKKKHLTN